MALKTINKITKAQDLFNIYKPLMILMVICGFNCGITKTCFIKYSLKLYTLFLVVAIGYASMWCCDVQSVSFVWSLLEYSIYVGIMLFYESKITSYFHKVYLIDTYLRINHRTYYRTRNKLILLISFCWTVRLSYSISYCLTHKYYNNFLLFLIYEFSLFALDLNRIWRYWHFEQIWSRVHLLRKRLEETPECNIYLYVKDNKMMRENKVRFCFMMYRKIGDLLNLISPELDASFFISIVCSLPKLIINVYSILLVIDNQLPYTTLGYMMMNLIQVSSFIFLPCVVVEMCKAEVEKIRMFLMHQLIHEIDQRTKEDLDLFLRYTQLRPFSYKVWRLIPIDLTLPLTLINLCTTYVIVIVNFTQVFTSG